MCTVPPKARQVAFKSEDKAILIWQTCPLRQMSSINGLQNHVDPCVRNREMLADVNTPSHLGRMRARRTRGTRTVPQFRAALAM